VYKAKHKNPLRQILRQGILLRFLNPAMRRIAAAALLWHQERESHYNNN
jgi:hypothetical protein